MPKWLRNGFKSSTGQPVKNAPLIRYLSSLLDLRAREGQKVRRPLLTLSSYEMILTRPGALFHTRSTSST